MKNSLRILLFALAIMISTDKSALSDTEMTPYIAKWFKEYTAAVSLRFDDASVTHVKRAVPLLNKYDLKGTFMINPGRRAYQNHKQFWEKDVPEMGHSLGNHTWSHKGAATLEDAHREIGSVSRLIWSLYPNQSKLLVFASGGGETWGGKRWSKTDSKFKALVEEYHLIDLYDGNHPSYRGDSKKKPEDMINRVKQAVEKEKHQPFHFHSIGVPYTSIKGAIRGVIYGHDLAFKTAYFEEFLVYLSGVKEDVWVATILDILKYETQYQNAELTSIQNDKDSIRLKLSLSLNTELYDHPLTIVIPRPGVTAVEQIIDGESFPLEVATEKKTNQIDVRAVDSEIVITF